MPIFDNGFVHLYRSDARELPIPDRSIDCVVTSPPYWGLRDYGIDGQLGLEAMPQEYVASMVEVFREVWRVLKPTGTVWLNLGDSYATSYPGVRYQNLDRYSAADGYGRRGGGHKLSNNPSGRPPLGGLKPKDLAGIPWRVAFALQDDGWYLRSDIIWSKPNPMPESVTDRPTKAHEYIFLLTKEEHYHYDADAIREPHTQESLQRYFRESSYDGSKPYAMKGRPSGHGIRKHDGQTTAGNGSKMGGHSGNFADDGTPTSNPLGRNKRTIWEITTQPYPDAHFATFPEALVEPCILAGCPSGGTVLDPFAGSGTTLVVAQKLGRKAIGTDINPEYLKLAAARVTAVTLPMQLF